jgi:L-lactate utilization protein LutC
MGASPSSPPCVTWRVPAVSRSTGGRDARARSVTAASSPDSDRPNGDSDRLAPKRHPATTDDEARRLPDDPLGGFELLNRLAPYDPYERFDRPAVDAGSTESAESTDTTETPRLIGSADTTGPTDTTGTTDASEPGDRADDDHDELVDAFVRAVEAAGGECHRVTGDVPDTLLDRLVADLDAWEIVFSGDADESELAQRLRNRGADVSAATPERAVAAGVGLNMAVAGIADSGSLVLDTSHKRGRLASLLPPVQLCLVPAERLVATAADALGLLGEDEAESEGGLAQLPASLTVVAGPHEADGSPSRQPLTRRTHRPSALHVIVVRPTR